MKAPIFFLQLDVVLSEKDAQAIREALDYAYSMGYKDAERTIIPYTPPNLPIPVPATPSYPLPPFTWLDS